MMTRDLGENKDCAKFPGLGTSAIGLLMPMFLWVDEAGRVRDLGPTLEKVLGTDTARGQRFEALFNILLVRPRGGDRDRQISPGDTSALAREVLLHGATRLHLEMRARPGLTLRGTSVLLGQCEGHGVLLNLTFGIHMAEAVREFGLSEADFAASDLAIELLYLGESNAAVLGELSELTARLELARRSAVAQSMTDPLTGLANRRAFELAISEEIEAQERGGSAFSVAHVDLDYFKEVNDTYGHAAGDQVLNIVAQRLNHELRQTDLVARTGGDEFLILLRGIADTDQVLALTDRLVACIEEPCHFDGVTCQVSASIGSEPSVGYTEATLAQMLMAADRALYAAKRSARGRSLPVSARQFTALPPGSDPETPV